jgi:hypothetical protein
MAQSRRRRLLSWADNDRLRQQLVAAKLIMALERSGRLSEAERVAFASRNLAWLSDDPEGRGNGVRAGVSASGSPPPHVLNRDDANGLLESEAVQEGGSH